jgi:hypothetical protein
MSNCKDLRLAVAPMMDWTDRAEKGRQIQNVRRFLGAMQYQMQYCIAASKAKNLPVCAEDSRRAADGLRQSVPR